MKRCFGASIHFVIGKLLVVREIKQIDKKATPRRTITATTGEPINCPKAALSEAKIGIPRPAASIIDAEKLYDMTFPLI